MGGLFTSLFGGGYSAPEIPETTPQPVREAEKEPEARAVRDEERRRLKSRQAMSGTLLTSPLGTTGKASGLLGSSLK